MMQPTEVISLLRDCEAVQIPAGVPITLPKGTSVRITQSLGGTYTVMGDFGMARIAEKDVDALGRNTAQAAAQTPTTTASGPVDEKLLWDQMRTCFDPEIPVNIVDLGLIYDCHVEPLPAGGNRVEVKMTLTAPGCGMGPMIAGDVEYKLHQVPGVSEVKVDVVWDPPWNQSMMSESAKLELGLM